MPVARFKDVYRCSSEDKNYPATNLVSNSNKKWRVEETGLDSAYVVLQLENPTKINGIDIGNENSAFIEVSVGRTGWTIEKYKTILVASSFMTVVECRVSENPNRVRCFAKDALMPDVVNEKWEFVKVTCTQGFNKRVQYGISFIRIHTVDAVAGPSLSPAIVNQSPVAKSPKEKKNCDEALGLPKNSVFAKFRMRNDSSDSDKETAETSSLFSKWKEEKVSPKKETTTLTAAAAIREASTSMSKLEESTKINKKIDTPSAKSRRSIESDKNPDSKKRLDRYRPAILYDEDDENTSNPRLEKLINEDKERIERDRKAQIDSKKAKKDTPREEKIKKKMESSADKFKIFLEKDNLDQSPEQSNQAQTSDADIQAPVDVDVDVDDDVVDVKSQSPAKVNVPDSPKASSAHSKNPPAWKVKNKRPATADGESASKRSRNSDSDDEAVELLKNVVFVISGIQNPDRAEIRSRGLEMGAKYRPDWDDSCTHLICAFKNTPKYKQVQGSGIIVNKKWITDCYAQKKKLPWQDYQL